VEHVIDWKNGIDVRDGVVWVTVNGRHADLDDNNVVAYGPADLIGKHIGEIKQVITFLEKEGCPVKFEVNALTDPIGFEIKAIIFGSVRLRTTGSSGILREDLLKLSKVLKDGDGWKLTKKEM